APFLTNLQSFIIGIAPTILVQPISQAAVLHSQVVLRVSAQGDPAPSYQWRKNGSNIPNANGNTYVIPSIDQIDVGSYDVVISNPIGSITSQVATVSILYPPVIEQGLANVIVDEGNDLQLAVVATGTEPLSYFWYKDSTLIESIDTPVLNLPAIQEPAQGVYKVVVSNVVGTVSSIATVTVNQKPIANSSSVSMTKNSSKQITLSGTDPDGDNLTFEIVDPPSHGTLTGTAPHFLYTPETDYVGDDSFTFSVNDGRLTSLAATVNISIIEGQENHSPIAENLSVTNAEDTPLIINLPASDPDNDPLTFIIVSEPTNGTVMLLSNNVALYQPNTNYVGIDTFTFIAEDAESASDIATVEILITNIYDAPVISSFSTNTVEDTTTPVLIDLKELAVSPDGLELTYGLTSDKSANGGTISIIDGVVSYVPAPDFYGVDTIEYQVSDGTTIVIGVITVNVENVYDVPRPILTNAGVSEDTLLRINLGDLAVSPDGLPLNYGLTSGNTARGGIISIDENGDLIYTPAPNFNGTDAIEYTVSDGESTYTNIIEITVAADNDVRPYVFSDAVSYDSGGVNPVSVLMGDFVKDSKLDIVVVNQGDESNSGNIMVMAGDAKGNFTNSEPVMIQGKAIAAVSGDFDKDLVLDIAVLTDEGVKILKRNSEGGYNVIATLAVGSMPTSIVAADFDKDLRLDIAVGDFSGVVKIWLNKVGGWIAGTDVMVGGPVSAVSAGDVFKNAKQALLVADAVNNKLLVRPGDGKGAFSNAVEYAVGTTPISIAVGD
ncbi:MAG TPA: Ig-like domain-containing protein, partial [Verrucomicrobiota bacterium]|nr:Ig-like domain-containing protein [Verrucomicrobiota bacterium]